jgi:hypothetical protein
MKIIDKMFNIKALAVVSMVGVLAVMVVLMWDLRPSKHQLNPAANNWSTQKPNNQANQPKSGP